MPARCGHKTRCFGDGLGRRHVAVPVWAGHRLPGDTRQRSCHTLSVTDLSRDVPPVAAPGHPENTHMLTAQQMS